MRVNDVSKAETLLTDSKSNVAGFSTLRGKMFKDALFKLMTWNSI